MLLATYQAVRDFTLPSEKARKGGTNNTTAFDTATGRPLWESPFAGRPVIVGKTIIMEKTQLDLLSGEATATKLARSYGCGICSASRHLMAFRSATLGYCELPQEAGVISYGGVRPGCWINAIPAGGILLMPDATSQCTCSYENRAWLALQPLD